MSPATAGFGPPARGAPVHSTGEGKMHMTSTRERKGRSRCDDVVLPLLVVLPSSFLTSTRFLRRSQGSSLKFRV